DGDHGNLRTLLLSITRNRNCGRTDVEENAMSLLTGIDTVTPFVSTGESNGTISSKVGYDLPKKTIITKALAHVVKDENLFVHEVVKVGSDKFESEFIVDGAHPYLYENAVIANHVSGTTFLDTSRQLLKAITHLFYAVPLANRFVIRTAHMD